MLALIKKSEKVIICHGFQAEMWIEANLEGHIWYMCLSWLFLCKIHLLDEYMCIDICMLKSWSNLTVRCLCAWVDTSKYVFSLESDLSLFNQACWPLLLSSICADSHGLRFCKRESVFWHGQALQSMPGCSKGLQPQRHLQETAYCTHGHLQPCYSHSASAGTLQPKALSQGSAAVLRPRANRIQLSAALLLLSG